jgi:hypothetical protein
MEKDDQAKHLWYEFCHNTGFHGMNKISGLSKKKQVQNVNKNHVFY